MVARGDLLVVRSVATSTAIGYARTVTQRYELGFVASISRDGSTVRAWRPLTRPADYDYAAQRALSRPQKLKWWRNGAQ